MRYALVNPPWTFDGSIYFGCREPHLPLELGYSKALLEQHGHETVLIDGHMDGLTCGDVFQQVADFAPDFIVITTAPTYLFWRCPPPEVRVPLQVAESLRGLPAKLVIVGPHGSTTPRATLRKLNADYVVLGECEEILPQLSGELSGVTSIAFRNGDDVVVRGPNRAADMKSLPALAWPDGTVAKHRHHHHRFDTEPLGPGA